MIDNGELTITYDKPFIKTMAACEAVIDHNDLIINVSLDLSPTVKDFHTSDSIPTKLCRPEDSPELFVC